jgi:uncharacterized protein YjcR
MAICNKDKKEISHKMKFEGAKLKDIAVTLQISLRTASAWMKDYDKTLWELRKILGVL